jgi:hypothetical protein
LMYLAYRQAWTSIGRSWVNRDCGRTSVGGRVMVLQSISSSCSVRRRCSSSFMRCTIGKGMCDG